MPQGDTIKRLLKAVVLDLIPILGWLGAAVTAAMLGTGALCCLHSEAEVGRYQRQHYLETMANECTRRIQTDLETPDQFDQCLKIADELEALDPSAPTQTTP